MGDGIVPLRLPAFLLLLECTVTCSHVNMFVTGKSSAALQEVEEDFDMKQHVDSLLRETGMAGLRSRNMTVDDLLT